MTKFKKLTIVKRMFAIALAATMAFSLSSVQLFAKENADVQVMQDGISVYSVDETQGGKQTDQSDSNQSESDSSNQDETGSADNSGTTTETTSETTTASTEDSTATTTTTENTTPTTPAAEPKPVGTVITEGIYEYKVTSSNTVELMGFAGDDEATYVKVKNRITYDGVTYDVTSIAMRAFMKESSIEKVLIRKNVTDIGKRAFFQCKNLETVRIKTGAKVIRKCAFKGCKALRVVNIHSAVLEDVKANAFKNVNSNLVINVSTKAIRKMLKASVPSYITINRAFNAPSTNSGSTAQ